MTTSTPNLSLVLYDSSGDQSATFATWRAVIDGPASSSNFYKIDTAYGVQAAQITSLQGTRGAIPVASVFQSANFYSVTGITAITAYTTGMTIILSVDVDSSDTVTLNINSLGIKSVMKTDSSGTPINLTGSDLNTGRYYLFIYDGTRWMWVSSNSADQINIVGTSGNLVTVNSDNTLLGTLTQSLMISQTINSAANKATPVDADRFAIWDSAASILKHTTFANIKSVLLTYFYTIFPAKDGWMPVSDTWTYASTTTITIPSDGTITYQKGMKIRFKQGGAYKYLPIKTVAATLLTTFTTSDYSVANAAITDIAYSFYETPLGWPDWFNFTATWTGITGSGASVVRYSVHGNIMNCVGSYTFAADSAVTGDVHATVPATVQDTTKIVTSAEFKDATASISPGTLLASSDVYMRVPNTASTYSVNNVLSSTVPFTWAINDIIRFGIVYEW